MTIKEELYKIYNEYYNVESHEDAGVMIEFTEKNITVITKKLDEKITFLEDRIKTKEALAERIYAYEVKKLANTIIECNKDGVKLLKGFKEELEK